VIPVVKLDSRTLRTVVKALHRGDLRCVVGPEIGEDAAVIDIRGLKNLAIHSDPITGAESMIGTLSVIVPSNDVACEGAEPRWLSVCMMLPENYPEDRILDICRQIREACDRYGIDVIGGHTEYAPSLSRPIIVSTCMGPCVKPLSKRRISEGDLIVLARSPGIEASIIIITDLRDRLGDIDENVIRRVREYINDLSVIDLARAVRVYAVAMHDPTEGGIMQALYELAKASMRDVEMWLSEVRVRYEIAEVCRRVGVDPLRALSSGSLLVVVDKGEVEHVLDILRRMTGGEAAVIGMVRALSQDPSLYVLDRKGGDVICRVCEDVPDQIMSIL